MKIYLTPMSSLGRNVIAEVYKKQLEAERYKLSTIELNDYFKYSGKEEHNNRLIAITPKYRVRDKMLPISNDMRKYILKTYKNEKRILR